MIKFLFWELQEYINNKEELKSQVDSLYNFKNFFNQLSQLSSVSNQHADILSQLNDVTNNQADVISQLNNTSNQHANLINNFISQFSTFRSKSFKEPEEKKDDVTFFFDLMDFLLKSTAQSNSSVNKHEARITNLEASDTAKLVEIVRQQNDRIAQLENKIAGINISPPTPAISSEEIKKELDGLRSEMEQEKSARLAFEKEYKDQIDIVKKYFAQQIQARDEAIEKLNEQFAKVYIDSTDKDNKIIELNERLQKQEAELKARETKIAELEQRLSKLEAGSNDGGDVEPKIFKFLLPSSDEVFISGTHQQIITKIKSAMNIDEIKNFLHNSGHPQKNIFLRNFEKHVSYLQKMLNKLNLKNYDDATISEEVTEKYFKVFQPTLLDNVAVSIYRGLDKEPQFYGEFLNLFNAYLQRCGLYTRKVTPDIKAVDSDYEDMKPIPRVVQDFAQDKMILEVQQLPYYINYLDDEGNVQNLFHDGKMIVARA